MLLLRLAHYKRRRGEGKLEAKRQIAKPKLSLPWGKMKNAG
jgi:hypothetical protein